MRVRTILSIPILALIILGAFSSTGVSSRSSRAELSQKRLAQLRELQNASDVGSVDWFLRRAKVTGEKEVILPALHLCGPEVPDLNAALTEYKVIVAQSIESYVQPHQMGLMTWYKFRIIEDLSLEPIRECSTCNEVVAEHQEIPAQLLPLAPDEIVVPHIGGRLEIDGVKLVQPNSLSVDFSTGLPLPDDLSAKGTESSPYRFVVNRKTFLLFLSIQRGSKVGALHLGDAGVFSCDSGGELTPFGAAGSIKLHLTQNRIHSLTALREYWQPLHNRL